VSKSSTAIRKEGGISNLKIKNYPKVEPSRNHLQEEEEKEEKKEEKEEEEEEDEDEVE